MKTALNKLMLAVLMSWGLVAPRAYSETVLYKVSMSLNIPRVYNNTTSMGSRKIQRQRIFGYVYIDKDANVEQDGPPEPSVTARDFVNYTHEVSGYRVSYSDCEATDVMWRYIGDNRTGVFKRPNLRFTLNLNPSYNIGADEPDNTLIVTLSGYGHSERAMRGFVTGQIGCGCHAYGHVSPTRTITCLVNDIVPICGTFTMRRISVRQ